MLRYLENLVSNEAKLTENPGEYSVIGFPPSKRVWKASWKNPETKHCFVSGWEGLSRNERITQHNPPVSCRGVVVDLDCAPVELNFAKGYEPSYISRSFSGGYHLHYLFEDILHVGNVTGLAAKFQETLEDKLSLEALPGYDRKAFRSVSQYYEVGREWAGDGKRLSNALVQSWFGAACKRFRFQDSGEANIPIDKVRSYLAEKYPNKWPGGWQAFDIGARGVRFWDDDGDSFSVIVRETGLTCFTSTRGFIPWRDEDLMGAKAVAQYIETALTEPTADVWFDGSAYWKQTARGKWVSRNEQQTKDDLYGRGISNRSPEGGGAPPLVQAMTMIRDEKPVKIVSMMYTPVGIRRSQALDAEHELNVGNVQALPPAKEAGDYGERFPRLGEFLSAFLDEGPRSRFLAHLAHAYKCGVDCSPSRGLGCIIAGPVGNGKTFTVNQICGRLLGGSVDASPYLIDGDRYNVNIIQSPVWALDDVASKGNWAEHSRFSQMFKRAIANDEIPCRAMYKSPVQVRWTGRIYMTANDDYESINALPRTDINIKDKLLILWANKVSMSPWISNEELEEELPHLGAWLFEHRPDPELVGGRFGVRPWVDPSLDQKIEDVGPKAPGDEILTSFRESLNEPWEGTTTELFDALVIDSASAASRTFSNPQKLGWHLKTRLDSGDPGYSKRRSNRGQVYTIQPSKQSKASDENPF